MNNCLFIDTLFVIAFINRRDQYHPQAVVMLAERYEGWPLLTTDGVLLEIGNALARHHKPEAIAIIERFLAADEVEVVHLNPGLFQKAFELYQRYQDKSWGLVDCVSFVVMREAGIHQALTFDQHFSQAGFECLLQEQV